MTDEKGQNRDDAFVDFETQLDRNTAAFLAASFATLQPLAEDRTARMLGLVPDAKRSLDSNKLKSARTAAHVGVEGLAALLRARGWKTTALDIIHWEDGKSSGVPPAVIAAIADELHVETYRLTKAIESPAVSRLDSLRESAMLKSLVARVAKARSLSTEAAFSFLDESQPSFAYRGNASDEQYLQILAQFVSHLEESGGTDG
jgi:hypothetical protein